MWQTITDFLFQTDRPSYRNWAVWMWRLLFIGIGAVVLIFVLLSFTNLPSVSQLENPKSELASVVYGATGAEIGRYYIENRVPVGYEELSPHLVNALVATEDERYYAHTGIDFRALGRVAVKTIALQKKGSGGASTITQQLAKLLFTGQKADGWGRVLQKLREWIIAVRLERRYTKEEILAMYLNKFNFINGAYGIKAASEIYFDRPQDSLEIQEAAVLIGMLKNPSLFNPLRRPEQVVQRRNVVFTQMYKNGLLRKDELESLKKLPLGIRFTRQTHIDGIAPYFRMELAKHIKEEILSKEQYYKPDGTPYDIYRDGLRIYTTIDPEMQKIAEDVMARHMAKIQNVFFKSWNKRDPWKYSQGSDTEIPVSVRAHKLKGLVRASDRYQVLRDKYLLDVTEKVRAEMGDDKLLNEDWEIDLVMAEAARPDTLSRLVKTQKLKEETAKRLKSVLRSDHFTKLRTAWTQLQDASDREFNTPVAMRVFAYNDEMEKDTVMSPLDSIRYHRMFLQTGILAVDPVTGYVRVWVGGVNHKYFQYDHANINRQVGSTFKPFVYATAIEIYRFSPCYTVTDVAKTISPGEGNFGLFQAWTPANASGGYSGRTFNLRDGLRNSVNTVSVHLVKEIGDVEPIRGLVHLMGIDSTTRYPNGRHRVPKSPAICLGATDLSVMEMTGAYTTFANNGLYVKPVFVTRIEDRNGRVIYSAMPEEKQAISPSANYAMLDLLKYSATNMGGIKSEVGGKTGTTNDYVDGWFMGITPRLVVGTWVGGEDRWIRFLSLANGQGSYMAKPFFTEFMRTIENTPGLDYDASLRFARPPGDMDIELDCSKYSSGRPAFKDLDDEFSNDIFGDEKPEGEQE
ncbi:MAG: transglycosylase domain-containing protein [Saprospiraceae bacterium]|nr:transglycosylase domain-containing protein [Saprospiraceae bacterium]